MKFVITLLCAVVAVTTTQAQRAYYAAATSTPAVSPLYIQPAEPLQARPRNLPGQHGIRTGKTLTIIGSVVLAGGIALVSTADALYYNSNTTNGTTTEEGDIKGGIGSLMVIAGTGMIIPGVIIWTKSKRRYERYLNDHPEQRAVTLNIRGASAGVAYRF